MAREKIFRFKQFSVVNDKTAMKVGTDGVLLGAWCNVAGASRVLDVGTGCGVIALMIAQRNNDAVIHAIDIDCNAVDEAHLNFLNSPWSNRLCALNCDFNEFITEEKYDLIVSNPPFFTNGVLSTDKGRNHARHATLLTFDDLIVHSNHLLAPQGVIALITPVDAEPLIRRCLVDARMNVRRLTQVIPIAGSCPKRLLWEIVDYETTPVVSSLTIENNNHCYTQEYIELTHEFYLKM